MFMDLGVDAKSVKEEIESLYNISGLSREVEVNRFDIVTNDFKEPEKEFREQVVVRAVVMSYDSYGPRYDQAGKYKDSNFVLFLPTSFKVEDSDEFFFDDDWFVVGEVLKKPLGDLLVHQRVFVNLKQEFDDSEEY